MLRVDAEVPPLMAAFAQCRYWDSMAAPSGRRGARMEAHEGCKEDVADGIKGHGAG